MGTIPGAVVIPAHFGESVILYSEVERVEVVVDGAPAGPDGRLFTIEPGHPKRVPYEAARFILDHFGYTGVVRVNVVETDSGTTNDLATARRESIEKIKMADDMRFRAWVASVVEDYIRKNKPVPQPDDAIMRVIERRGYDLKQYGIVPVGWAEKEKADELDALRAQVKALEKKLSTTA
jgi:hypothetical protein